MKTQNKKNRMNTPLSRSGAAYAKSFGESPLSFSMLLNTFGWSILDAWKGTVTRTPRALANIIWLPLCRTSAKPLRVRTETACPAVMRGRRVMQLFLHRHLDRGENDISRLFNIFFSNSHVFEKKSYHIVNICERFLVCFALRVAPLQRGTDR